jgi:hypothetical protein
VTENQSSHDRPSIDRGGESPRSEELLRDLWAAADVWRRAVEHARGVRVKVSSFADCESARAALAERRQRDLEAQAASVEFFAILSEYRAELVHESTRRRFGQTPSVAREAAIRMKGAD